MDTLTPTLGQRFLRAVGRLKIPRMEGVCQKLASWNDPTPRRFTVRFAGLNYNGRLDQHIDRKIYFLGAYSPGELDFLDFAARVLRERRCELTFADIGANVGQHSLYMCGRVDNVFAFEPNDEAADQFELNLRLNGLSNVKVLRYALGSEDGTAELGSGLAGNSGSRSLTWSLDAAKNTTVQVRHAGRAMTELGIDHLDLLKIDVEGFEKNVLDGLHTILQRDRPIIVMEMVGVEMKGGFRAEAELRDTLYDNHCLFSLGGARKSKLTKFDWSSEEIVCLPQEVAERFQAMVSSRAKQ
ncbi:MAG: FkbM family methyltransferase [bacterium]|nr:FkbM family methyltransferase [bacterium]